MPKINRPTTPTGQLRVDVRDLADQPLADAVVTLKPSAHGGRRPARAKDLTREIRLKFDKAGRVFAATNLVPGLYQLSVSRGGLEAQEREITVQPGGSDELFILGKKGLPSYFRGRVRVPFEVDPDLIGVVFRRGIADAERTRFLTQFARTHRLEREETPELAVRSGMQLFRLTQASAKARRDALAKLRENPSVEHAGIVISRRTDGFTQLTDEAVVRFKGHVTEPQAHRIAREFGFVVMRVIPYSPNTFHLRWNQAGSVELLAALDKLAQLADVEWAEPNVYQSPELDAITPPDVLWQGCWDRQLIGCPDAWQHLQDAGINEYGDPGVIIAVVDSGTQSSGGAPTNPDFQGTVSNGATKLYQAFDFANMVANNDNPWSNHGSGVAGIVSARAANPAPVAGQSSGVAGSAPNCRLITIAHGGTETTTADIYIWAAGFNANSPLVGFPAQISPGADVFTCSLGLGAGAPLSGTAQAMLDYVTSFGRGGKGCMCFFSTGNANSDNTTNRPYSAYQKCFGIAATSYADDGVTEIRGPYSGHGKIALCAPSQDQVPAFHNPPTGFATWAAAHQGMGNLISHRAIETTLTAATAVGANSLTLASVAGLALNQVIHVGTIGVVGSEPARITAVNAMTSTITVNGWNGGWVGGLVNAHAVGDPVAQGPADHRNNFGGTSSATPLTAGVAALVLSAEPDLTWVEAREILRDTAVKFDLTNTDPVGQWLDINGNPSNTSGLPPVRSAWYGYGRVDADSAVQAAVSYAFTRDVVVRDNLADTGAVPSTGAFWSSPDIWVRNLSPAAEGAAALPANYATAGPHQNAIAGQPNWVYARVRNNGTDPSLDCFVRISLTHWPGTEFTYPSSFSPTTRPGDPIPSPLTTGTYLIGEVKISGLAAGTDQIVNVQWPTALIPPEFVMMGMVNVKWHPCLLVECSPLDGPTTGNHVWDSNSLAQKNIAIVYTDALADFASAIIVGNEENLSECIFLEIDRGYLPRQVTLYVDLVSPQLRRRLRAWLASEKARGTLAPSYTAVHALSYGSVATVVARKPFTLGHFNGREVVFLSRRTARVPICAGAGALSPIIVGGIVGKGARPGDYSVTVLQRNLDGAVSGSAEVVVTIRK
ncbi:MAG: S8 family serine peptidase [Gemmatimonadaceae bacterium]